MKQPYYHRVDGLSFFSANLLSQKEILSRIAKGLRSIRCGFIKESLDLEEPVQVTPNPMIGHKLDGLLFTATEPLTVNEFLDAMKSQFPGEEITVGIDADGYSEPEAGDPYDL